MNLLNSTFRFQGMPPLVALLLAAMIVSVANAQTTIKVANIDRSIDPCTDFFMFATGVWQKSTEIPADRSTWGSWGELSERNYTELKAILDGAAAANAPAGSDQQKIGDFYLAGMDSAAIESMRLKPLDAEFARIAAIKDVGGLVDEFANLHKMMIRAPFVLEVYQDPKNSSKYMIQLAQSGLGLPDRDYYVNDDDESKELRQQYLAHVAKMFTLLGENQAEADKRAAIVMSVETRLAKASMTQVQQRDPDSIYHKMTVSELKTSAAPLDWDRYFAQLNLKKPGDINNNQPLFLKELALMLNEVSVADWQTYFRWHLIHEAAAYLSTEFVNEDFNFNGKILSGRRELRPRWKRVLSTTDNYLGEILGKQFVEEHFSPESKKHAEQIVINLKASLHDRLAEMDWISETTRQKAFEKLDAIRYKIGYPDKWRDYSKLEIKRDSYVQNVLRASAFEFQRNLDKLDQPVDRDEWFMSAPTINAYYDAYTNEVVFPAGILQPPFFDATADDALNYGGIGSIIGHELTHGFDDEGRKFDAQGNLKDWWTPEDGAKFVERARMIEEQFDGYIAIDSLHVLGKLTAGENIADLGGLKIAYYAYLKSLEGKPRPPDIDGFTPEQRFFLSFAESWRSKIRDEAARMYAQVDPHSPDRYRVNGPISNLPEFAKAFGCKADSPGMRSAALQVKIW